ncbi:hypothetical protein GLE_5090 [Lysobacter enzymogenes]|uniref:Uncharacterized protein n=1 Tax=Lysobacter enzymogenes TaxID=69 RepID=A0A0S2DQ67_LYSEN|nr:hypothetical protein GLE_5090 [Lysobacter enzymogenes]
MPGGARRIMRGDDCLARSVSAQRDDARIRMHRALDVCASASSAITESAKSRDTAGSCGRGFSPDAFRSDRGELNQLRRA